MITYFLPGKSVPNLSFVHKHLFQTPFDTQNFLVLKNWIEIDAYHTFTRNFVEEIDTLQKYCDKNKVKQSTESASHVV